MSNQTNPVLPAPDEACSMRTLPKVVTVTRRGFLKGGSLAALIGLGAPTVLAAPVRDSLAAQFKALGPETAKTLLVVVRDIYPHERIPDNLYAQALAPYEEAAAHDAALKTLLVKGARNLDASARAAHQKPYADVPAEADRVALLLKIESTAFFTRLRNDLVTSLYNNKAVWPLLGYEGSSWEKGGYLHRGLDDIDWV